MRGIMRLNTHTTARFSTARRDTYVAPPRYWSAPPTSRSTPPDRHTLWVVWTVTLLGLVTLALLYLWLAITLTRLTGPRSTATADTAVERAL
jgi:type VI protein secretion system component VasF